ncbi:zinc-binding dehydrogenase [Streptomyces sp. SAJ15]|uniref:zinc-binding dehydrogenase n=1 Tax=Streptomyces sp. SAJ15 TaxID=2011095 RepID=UPI00118483F4|nr:zinc-binding dehydrogenase [Streptomyces sp. SAJ15]TVL88974.1 alcohol dehydrogenase [Streptomyces sp. SAJ15]
MRALIYDPEAPQGLRLDEVPDPVPGEGQALVEVRSISFNYGDLKYRPELVEPGAVSGWDAAGVVVRAAADGSGPAVGTRVVTFGWNNAWAELRAVDTAELAVVPDSVDLGAASALPVAGVTALQALRKLGPVVGRRVLITGASGGVGRFAVQLAARAGAEVVAVVGSPERAEGLAELGAQEVLIGDLEKISGPLHGILDNVGGPLLGEAMFHLAPGGVVQWIGNASQQPLQIGAKLRETRKWRLETFFVDTPIGADLQYLVDLLTRGELDPQIGWRGPWDRAPEAAEALFGRRVQGKAVLDLPPRG